ncbi:Nucleotidyltransferase [Viridothelium virens]|uniref:DNA polymerase n=1 Tax=Viridothelium virens TaxID=1048519 RepID=A0A6A6H653_VIRVR|nr:Nucleotidyltransferase [Viridothelium virens]
METKVDTSSILRSSNGAALAARPSQTLVSALPRPIGKRKRANVYPKVAEARQIFRGLAFYFFPNNDVSPARRMRIHKALEYGALWIKDWAQGISHVIVDRDLTYAQLLAWLKFDAMPAEVIVVDELYPADCITYRFLVDPKQFPYRVQGQPDEKPEKPCSSTDFPSTDSSLQLKPPRKDTLRQEPRSPSRTEDSNNEPRAEYQEQTQDYQLDAEEFVAELDKPRPSSTVDRRDSFDEVIREAKSLEHLPLDDEDEDAAEGCEDVGSDSQDSSSSPIPTKRPRRTGNSSRQSTFQCMEANNGKGAAANPNARTIEILEQMGRYYDRVQDHWRTLAYRRAITSLKRETRKITTKEEAVLLPFIGERLAAKIEEIVWTNRLRRLENAQLDPTDRILQLFLGIYSVGFAQASRWVRQGYRTLADLLHRAPLTTNQRIGIAHYDDFALRIPRNEVTQHGAIVRDALHALDPDFEVVVGGSYRRGALTCGDIDCIITHPTHSLSTIRALVFDTLVPQLFEQGYLRASLAASTSASSTGTKWHGAAALPTSPSGDFVGRQKKLEEGPWRRIDFLLVPQEETGAALIYFTGNDVFNRSIRLLASRKGMRLNQHGLFRDIMRGPGRVKVTDGILVEGRDERRIFEVLGVPWREPEERIC